MDFQNVKALNYEHSNKYLGNNSMRYASVVRMTISGYILNLSNTSGALDIFTACKNLSDSLNINQEIIINGINYGLGRITTVSFDSGNWTRVTEYSASIEIEKSAELASFSDSNFQNEIIQGVGEYAQHLEDFSESYDVEYDSNTNFVNGSHSIDIKVSSLFNGDKTLFAKNLADFLFSSTNLDVLSQEGFIFPPELKRRDIYSENYSLIDSSFGFKRNFSYYNSDSCYSKDRSVSVSLKEDGIIDVTESNNIKGECLEPDLISSARAGFNSELSGAYSRCNTIFDVYKNVSSDPLINKEVERSVVINNFTGEIEYSITFSNDKRRKNNYTHEYTLELSRDTEGIWEISESGTITGDGVLGTIEKFNTAFSGWSVEKNEIAGRISSIYSKASPKPPSATLKFITKNTKHAVHDGQVGYSYIYTDDFTLDMSSNIRRTILRIDENKGTRIHNDFIIPGGSAKYVVAQTLNQSNQSERAVNGELEISSSTLPFKGIDFFNQAVSLSNSKKGSGSDLYLDNFSFSSDEIEQSVSFQGSYKYSASSVS
jgi:hypothetical protein